MIIIITIITQKILKINKIVKSVCFHIIPNIHSPVKGFSAHISSDHNHVSRYKSNIFKLNKLNRRDKISFGAMPSPNIASLTVLLEKLVEQAKTGSLRHYAQPRHPRLNGNVKQDLPLPESQIGALKQPLFSAIIHGLLLY